VGLTSGAAPKKELTDYNGATVPEFHRLPNPQLRDNTIGVGLLSRSRPWLLFQRSLKPKIRGDIGRIRG
jgi:hypothetical protein